MQSAARVSLGGRTRNASARRTGFRVRPQDGTLHRQFVKICVEQRSDALGACGLVGHAGRGSRWLAGQSVLMCGGSLSAEGVVEYNSYNHVWVIVSLGKKSPCRLAIVCVVPLSPLSFFPSFMPWIGLGHALIMTSSICRDRPHRLSLDQPCALHCTDRGTEVLVVADPTPWKKRSLCHRSRAGFCWTGGEAVFVGGEGY